jgi:hypothetical protein
MILRGFFVVFYGFGENQFSFRDFLLNGREKIKQHEPFVLRQRLYQKLIFCGKKITMGSSISAPARPILRVYPQGDAIFHAFSYSFKYSHRGMPGFWPHHSCDPPTWRYKISDSQKLFIFQKGGFLSEHEARRAMNRAAKESGRSVITEVGPEPRYWLSTIQPDKSRPEFDYKSTYISYPEAFVRQRHNLMQWPNHGKFSLEQVSVPLHAVEPKFRWTSQQAWVVTVKSSLDDERLDEHHVFYDLNEATAFSLLVQKFHDKVEMFSVPDLRHVVE